MATNIGPKIGVEGAAEYRKQMNQIISQAKELDSEMKLVTSTFTKETSAEEKNAKQKQVLTKQIENQKQRVKTLQEQLEKTSQAYGENDARTIKLRTSLNNAQTALNKMENEMNEMEKETKETTVELNSFDRALNAGISHLPSLGSLASSVASTISTVLVTAITATTTALIASAKAMVDWAKDAGTYADEILTLAQVTSMDTDTLQELAYMADLVDVELNTITSSMARNIRSMNQAKDGTGEAAEAYKQLGVEIVGANGELKDGETVYWELIDALGKVENETERDALAMTLFGRSAQELNPLINAGSKQVKQYADEAHKAGAVMNKETLKSLGKMDDSFQRLKQGAGAAKRALGATFAPSLTKMADGATDALGKFANAVNDADGDTDKMREAFSQLIKDMANLVGDNLPEIIDLASDIIQALMDAFAENPDKIKEAAKILIDKLIDGIHDNAGDATYNALDIILALVEELTTEENLQKIMDTAVDIINKLCDGLAEHADGIASAIPNLLQAFANELKDEEKRHEFAEAAKNFLHSFSTACANSMDTLAEIIPDLADAFVDVLTDPEVLEAFTVAAAEAAIVFWTSFLENSNGWTILGKKVGRLLKGDEGDAGEEYGKAGEGAADKVAEGVNKGADRVGQAAGNLKDKITEGVTGKGPSGKSGSTGQGSYEQTGEAIADELAKGMEQAATPKEAARSIEGAINSTFNDHTSYGDMKTSGQHLMEGLIAGIKSMMKDLKIAVTDTANIINSQLHFSRPDEGPLHNYESWMPDFMKGLANGIKSNAWRVREAVSGISGGMAMSLSPSADPSGASYTNMTTNVGGITVQVYGTEGQSVDALADRVMDKINVTLQNSGRVWA